MGRVGGGVGGETISEPGKYAAFCWTVLVSIMKITGVCFCVRGDLTKSRAHVRPPLIITTSVGVCHFSSSTKQNVISRYLLRYFFCRSPLLAVNITTQRENCSEVSGRQIICIGGTLIGNGNGIKTSPRRQRWVLCMMIPRGSSKFVNKTSLHRANRCTNYTSAHVFVITI